MPAPAHPARSSHTPSARRGLLIVLIIALGLIALRLYPAGASAIPAYFDKSVTFDEASRRARSDGRAVLVYVTADWCGPCQTFKRTTLSDPRVADWIRDNAVPVYADYTNAATASKTPLPATVYSFPTVLLYREGRELARTESALGPGQFLERLSAGLQGSDAALAAPPPAPR